MNVVSLPIVHADIIDDIANFFGYETNDYIKEHYNFTRVIDEKGGSVSIDKNGLQVRFIPEHIVCNVVDYPSNSLVGCDASVSIKNLRTEDRVLDFYGFDGYPRGEKESFVGESFFYTEPAHTENVTMQIQVLSLKKSSEEKSILNVTADDYETSYKNITVTLNQKTVTEVVQVPVLKEESKNKPSLTLTTNDYIFEERLINKTLPTYPQERDIKDIGTTPLHSNETFYLKLSFQVPYGSSGTFDYCFTLEGTDYCLPEPTWTTSTQVEWNAGMFTNTTSNSSGSLLLNQSVTGGYVDQYGNWTSPTNNTCGLANGTNLSWNLGLGEITNPIDEISPSMRDSHLIFLGHLNNDSGYGETETSIQDFTGNGNNATRKNEAFYNNTGKLGGAYQFDGTNDYLAIPNSASLRFTNNLTVATWIYIDPTFNPNIDPPVYGIGTVFNKDNAGDWGFSMGISSTGAAYANAVIGGVQYNANSTPNIPFGSWHHLVGVRSGTQLIVYVDGVNTTSTFDAATGDLRTGNTYDHTIGAWLNTGNNDPFRMFKGLIDEVAIWDRDLSNTEIGEIYNRTKKGRVRYQVGACNGNSCITVGPQNNTGKFFLNNTFSNLTEITRNAQNFTIKLFIDVENSTMNITQAAYADDYTLSYNGGGICDFITLSTAATNLTNSSTATAETFNSSVLITTSGIKANLTTILFIGGKVNQTIQHLNNYVSGTTFSYIWNDTNFTAGQNVTVQFNASEVVFSNYINATTVTIAAGNVAPLVVNASVNETNTTFTVTSDYLASNFTFSDTNVGDKGNFTLIYYVNGVANITVQANNNYGDGIVVNYIWNNTNITKGQTVVVGANATDGLLGSPQINTTAITVNNSAPNTPTVSINETNLTIYKGMLINASLGNVGDPDANDLVNATIRWYVRNAAVRNTTFTSLGQGRTPSDVLPASFVHSRGDTIRAEVWLISDNYNSTLVNSTAISVNNSNPVWNLANDTVMTTEDNNVNVNVTLNLSDRDNANFNLNHTNIKINDTLVVSACSITNGTHILTCTVQPNAYGYFQFNITSTLDNETTPQIGNTSLSVKIRVHSVDDAPVLSNAALNLTNSSTQTSRNLNASVSLQDADLNTTNINVVLFVNNKVNISLNMFNNWVNGTTPSIIFNNTNITGGDVVNVQFNSSDELSSNYINSTKWTVANTAPTTSITNPTNATSTNVTSINFTFYSTDPDKDLANITAWVDGLVNQTKSITGNSSTNIFYFNWSIGNHSIYGIVQDSTGARFVTGNNTLEILNNTVTDNQLPTITLNTPTNATSLATQNYFRNVTNFNISFTDNVAISNISIWFDGGHNQTISVSGTSGSYTFIINNILIGNHSWYGKGCDTSNNCNISIGNFSLEITNKTDYPPTFNLITPTNGSVVTIDHLPNITFSMTIDDDFGFNGANNITIRFDGTTNYTFNITPAGQHNTTTVIIYNIQYGNHTYEWITYDNNGQRNQTGNYSLEIRQLGGLITDGAIIWIFGFLVAGTFYATLNRRKEGFWKYLASIALFVNGIIGVMVYDSIIVWIITGTMTLLLVSETIIYLENMVK